MISTERLLPCPFCGGEVNGYSFATFMPDHPGFYVAECPACDFYLTRPTRAETVAAWNRRSGVEGVASGPISELLGGNEQAEGGSAALRLSVIEECAKLHSLSWPVIVPLYAHPAPQPVPDNGGFDGIRICPRRDGPCPHGMSCAYWLHDMECSTEPRPAAPSNNEGRE